MQFLSVQCGQFLHLTFFFAGGSVPGAGALPSGSGFSTPSFASPWVFGIGWSA